MIILGGLITALGSGYAAIGIGIIIFGLCVIGAALKRN